MDGDSWIDLKGEEETDATLALAAPSGDWRLCIGVITVFLLAVPVPMLPPPQLSALSASLSVSESRFRVLSYKKYDRGVLGGVPLYNAFP